MSVFDFHCHPFFKHSVSAADPGAINPLDEILFNDQPPAMALVGLLDFLDEISDIDESLNSQSALRQLHRGGVSVLVNGIVGIEKGFAENASIRLLSKISCRPAVAYLSQVVAGTLTYPQQRDREIRIWQEALDKEFADGIFLSAGKVGRPLRPQPNEIISFLQFEGGHLLQDDTLSPAEKLAEFKRSGIGKALITLNLCHLTEAGQGTRRLANFAYGMKLSKGSAFLPTGSGLTDDGRAVIDAAFTTDGPGGMEHRVLIDLKHLSLLSRRQLVAYREAQGYTAPLVCTHGGLTGMSLKDYAQTLWRGPDVNVQGTEAASLFCYAATASVDTGALTWFNPWTINLFDEEVEDILRSGGLFGISLDQRILGFGPKTVNGTQIQVAETFSMAELPEITALLTPQGLRTTAPDFAQIPEICIPPVDAVGATQSRATLQLNQFGLHICHVLALAARLSAREGLPVDGWDHLCIGSDYDGLIDPIADAINAAQLPHLKAALAARLPEIWQIYIRARPEAAPFEPLGDIPSNLEKLFATNGIRFLEDAEVWWG